MARQTGASSPAPTMLTGNSFDLPTELCLRAVAHIALTARAAAAAEEATPVLDDGELLSVLADILALGRMRDAMRQGG